MDIDKTSDLAKQLGEMFTHFSKAIDQYQTPTPKIVEGIVDNKNKNFPLLTTRKKQNQHILKAVTETIKKMKWEFGIEKDKIIAQIRKQYQATQDQSGDMGMYGGNFANDLMNWEAIRTELYLSSNESDLAKTVEKALCESAGVESIDELKGEKKKAMIVASEASRRVLSGTMGAYGQFAGTENDFDAGVLEQFRKQANMRYHSDPHIGGIIDSLVSYIVGRGVTFTCEVPEIQEYLINDYWKFNQMDSYHKERILKILINGEQFAKYHKTDNGKIALFEIEPDNIDDIEVKERFKLSFKYLKSMQEVIWLPSINMDKYKEMDLESEEVKESEEVLDRVFHMKIGLGLRGKPIALRVLRYAQYYDDFVRDTQRHWHEQTRVFCIKYSKDREHDALGSFTVAPAGGLMLVGMRDYLEYEFTSPQLNSSGADVLGRILRLSISTGFRTPEVVAFVDASEAVYASIKTTMNPFTIMIQDNQDTFEEMLDREARYFIDYAIETKKLPPKTKIKIFDPKGIEAFVSLIYDTKESELPNIIEQAKTVLGEPIEKEIDTIDVPINWVFPEVIEEDLKQTTEAMKIHDDKGWAHRSMIAEKFGWNYARVLAKEAEDRQKKMNQQDEDFARVTKGNIPPKIKDEEDEE